MGRRRGCDRRSDPAKFGDDAASPPAKRRVRLKAHPQTQGIVHVCRRTHDLCCPITLELFKDPVKTIHGQTYERSAIEDWLLTKNIDPMTGESLKIKHQSRLPR